MSITKKIHQTHHVYVSDGLDFTKSLYGAADDFFGPDEAVGFGNDFAVNAAGLVPT